MYLQQSSAECVGKFVPPSAALATPPRQGQSLGVTGIYRAALLPGHCMDLTVRPLPQASSICDADAEKAALCMQSADCWSGWYAMTVHCALETGL
ncbi:g4627 [Coccomyxa viridis]|uniref:G4627 protein n=1 Tax=Coccomyxa viridis TaxID=1274662 RepID=A0ABP1FQR7_9CHLO